MIHVVAWFILLVLCWPLALMALVVWPIVWLISIPLRLIGIGVGAALALVKTILFLPARMVGCRG
jgi:hypothetical protein